jgi:hypothetical protein
MHYITLEELKSALNSVKGIKLYPENSYGYAKSKGIMRYKYYFIPPISYFGKRVKSISNNQFHMKKLSLILTILFSWSISIAQEVLFNWARNLGNTEYMTPSSIATDNDGNVYTTGIFNGTIDFDPGSSVFNLTAPATGSGDIFIQKLDASGNFVWAKGFGGATGGGVGRYLVVDQENNIYITGNFLDTVDFDSGPLTSNLVSVGNNDIFIAKYNSLGVLIWAKSIGGATSDRGVSMIIDKSKNILITGYFSSTADFNPDTGTYNLTSAGGNDIFVLKLDSLGNYKWAKRVGGTLTDEGASIAVDSLGSAYLTGSFMNTVDFDPGSGTYNLSSANNGYSDIFILKLDSSGSFEWAKSMGASYINDKGISIGIDNVGDVYTSGIFEQTVDFDPGSGVYNITSMGYDNTFILKLNSSGNFIWVKAFSGLSSTAGSAKVTSMKLDAFANIYTVGSLGGPVDFDPSPGVYSLGGNGNIFVSKLDSSGDFVWAKNYGGVDAEGVYSLSLDAVASVHMVGYFKDTVDFDPGSNVFNLVNTTPYLRFFITKWHQCETTTTTINLSACNNYTSPSGNYIWSSSGVYTDTILNAGGCDSVITFNLTVDTIATGVTQNGIMLTANAIGVTYQWINCNGNIPVNSATNQSFVPTVGGSYAVVVNNGSCGDTSTCFTISGVGLAEVDFSSTIQVFPNPAKNVVTISFTQLQTNTSIKLMDVLGQNITTIEHFSGTQTTLDISNYAAGVYFLEIEEKGNTARIKLVKD